MLSGIPCCHAVTCFNERTEDPASAIPDIFRKEQYVQCYQPIIYPTNGQNLWEETPYPDILPPPVKKMPGRPKKSRNKAADEKRTESQRNRDPSLVSRKGKANKCSICKKSGHKKGSCKEAPPATSSQPQQTTQPQNSTQPATSSQPTKTSTRSNKKAKSATQAIPKKTTIETSTQPSQRATNAKSNQPSQTASKPATKTSALFKDVASASNSTRSKMQPRKAKF